jgi:16S rRNA G966 N2-methylase RsmD
MTTFTNQSQLYDYLNVTKLNHTMSDEDFEKALPSLSKLLFDYGFDKILKDYNQKSLKDAQDDWQALQTKNIDQDYINSTSTVGMAIIKKHMIHLYDVKSHKGICIRDLWTKENLEKVLKLNRKTHSTPYVTELIRQLGFMAGTSKVTIYRPLLTKRIVDTFQAKKILDVCVGWGGRMLGSVCLEGVHYSGIEPCTKTMKALKKMTKELNIMKQVKLYHGMAEQILPALDVNIKYDLALTSPPYYNLEIYSDEDTQSHQHGSYEDWVEAFLKPVVFGVLDRLAENGHSCWSVKNFRTDKAYPLYDDIVALHEERGWIQSDREFYIGNCLRPGLKDDAGQAAKSKESTYVFVKGE